MPISSRYLIFLCAAAAAAQDAPKPQFTARELFYSAASDPSPASKPPATTPTAAPKKAATATATPAPAPKKPATPPPPPTVVATTSTPTTRQPPTPPPAQSGALPGGGSVIRASAVQTAPAPVNGTPLGLKYTILKKSGDDMVEVPPDTVFHADDRIQVSVQTNGPGYLYVVHQGSSGIWVPVFPSPEVAEGDNHVDGWNALVVPVKARLKFDDLAGTEKLFIVFSRTPQENLENMIYSLQGSKIKPAADQTAPSKHLVVSVASVDIDNNTVGQLRDTYTRDLIIEKIDDKTPPDKSPAGKKDNATYVVNPSGSSESRVVADISMVHQ